MTIPFESTFAETIDWLLEEESPGARYLALRDLTSPADEKALAAARQKAHREGPIAQVLDNMMPEGYWVKPGPGYIQKYRSSVWAIILLSQLGANINEDERIARACDYMLTNALIGDGRLTSMTLTAPSGNIDCLQGNLCRALYSLGCRDERLFKAYEWMAGSEMGEDNFKYVGYKSGPNFECRINGPLPCAWGAVKVMLAFAALAPEQRSPLVERAISRGLDFMFSIEPRTARWPMRHDGAPNRAWWKFGFPVFYVTDLLQAAEALVELGYGQDERLAQVLNLVREKQNGQGRWVLEYDYPGKTWLDFGAKNEVNKWV
ncbi:MAG: hypothetical protein LWX83_14835, partial [Anaerolineae bacterium]|nr:hypothetical protein [Anaerolineae bacterium]